MTVRHKHLTRLTCDCGNSVEVEALADWGETELGSQYPTIAYKRPEGWTFAECRRCKESYYDGWAL